MRARRVSIAIDPPLTRVYHGPYFPTSIFRTLYSPCKMSGLLLCLFWSVWLILSQIPLVFILKTSSASLGSLTLYRSSIQSCLFTFQNLITTTRMSYQSIFLMGAFCAASEVRPRLQPNVEQTLRFQSSKRGVAIEARYISPKHIEVFLRVISDQESKVYISWKWGPLLERCKFQVGSWWMLGYCGI